MAEHAAHRAVHYWDPDLEAPLCGSAEDFFQWADSVDDVTCELCTELLSARHGEAREDRGRSAADGDAASP